MKADPERLARVRARLQFEGTRVGAPGSEIREDAAWILAVLDEAFTSPPAPLPSGSVHESPVVGDSDPVASTPPDTTRIGWLQSAFPDTWHAYKRGVNGTISLCDRTTRWPADLLVGEWDPPFGAVCGTCAVEAGRRKHQATVRPAPPPPLCTDHYGDPPECPEAVSEAVADRAVVSPSGSDLDELKIGRDLPRHAAVEWTHLRDVLRPYRLTIQKQEVLLRATIARLDALEKTIAMRSIH